MEGQRVQSMAGVVWMFGGSGGSGGSGGKSDEGRSKEAAGVVVIRVPVGLHDTRGGIFL